MPACTCVHILMHKHIYRHTFSCFLALTLPLALTLTVALPVLRKGDIDWLQFWRQAASEDWGQHHAALERFGHIVNNGCRSVTFAEQNIA